MCSVGVGDKIYVIGGRVGSAFISGTSNNVDLVEMYDPATNLWTPRTRMPTARSAIGAGVYHNPILVAGGEGQDQRFLAAFNGSLRDRRSRSSPTASIRRGFT